MDMTQKKLVLQHKYESEKELRLHGKKIGTIYGDVYTTYRDSVLHYYRKGQGYSISTKILDALKAEGIKKIRIFETGREDHMIKVYEAFVSDFDRVEPFHESWKKENTDVQKVIPLRRWELVNSFPE